MALTDDTTMLVQPASNGFGGFGDGNSFWILLLFILLGNGAWGMGGGLGGDGLYPWLNNSQNINGGFRDQMLGSQIQGIQNSITSGFGDVQTALCGGFAGVNATINGAQNAVTSQMYANQIADMERSFAAQTASTQGMTALQAQLAQCCCDNRSATQDLKYTVASENCSDRTQALQNTRDIIDAQTRNTQAILDKLCALAAPSNWMASRGSSPPLSARTWACRTSSTWRPCRLRRTHRTRSSRRASATRSMRFTTGCRIARSRALRSTVALRFSPAVGITWAVAAAAPPLQTDLR